MTPPKTPKHPLRVCEVTFRLDLDTGVVVRTAVDRSARATPATIFVRHAHLDGEAYVEQEYSLITGLPRHEEPTRYINFDRSCAATQAHWERAVRADTRSSDITPVSAARARRGEQAYAGLDADCCARRVLAVRREAARAARARRAEANLAVLGAAFVWVDPATGKDDPPDSAERLRQALAAYQAAKADEAAIQAASEPIDAAAWPAVLRVLRWVRDHDQR